MAPTFSDLIEQARLAARSVVEYGEGLLNPTVRLGITGLSRAGKTVFITALVHGLVRNGRFPVFEALAEERVVRARLSPQPDDAVPRFDYESHVHALLADRAWPESTRQISELRLIIEYQSRSGAMRELVLDMVDYPGEWLLDLPLLGTSFEAWSAASLALSRQQQSRHQRSQCDRDEEAGQHDEPQFGGGSRVPRLQVGDDRRQLAVEQRNDALTGTDGGGNVPFQLLAALI